MKRLLPNPLRLTGCLLFGLFAAGCTDEDTSMVVVANISRPAGTCEARPDLGATTLGTGFLDVGLRSNYVASLLVANQLTPRGDKANLRTETMQVITTGAEVRLLNDDGSVNSEFTVPASGVILPDPAISPGLGIVSVTLVPASAAEALRADLDNPSQRRTLVPEVKVFGRTVGGLEVESSVFNYVVRVCEGCLVARTALNNGVCDLTQPIDENDVPCFLGQDEAVDCRLCAGNAFCQ